MMRDEPKRGFLGPGHYTPSKIEIARRLRHEATAAEQLAWSILRRGGIDGWHFRRQQVVEGFIVDFFCAKLRLVIELDGAVHDDPERMRLDALRDDRLRLCGLKVVRIRNEIVSPATLRQIVYAATPPPTGGGAGEGA
jgi:very-short-patch-repair endonuclease